MYQDRYGDPGSPEEQHNASHQYVLQTSASGAVLFMVRRFREIWPDFFC